MDAVVFIVDDADVETAAVSRLMSRFMTPLFCLGTFGFSAFAQAQEAPPIVNGYSTTDYPAVGYFYMCSDTNQQNCWECSGTLIASRWVATAAHCVVGGNLSGEYYFIIGYSWDQATDYARIQTTYAHEQYDDQNYINDVALLKLSSAITSVSPMPVNTETVGSNWIGRELQVVGYGITGSNASDSGFKRTADMSIAEVYQEIIILVILVVLPCTIWVVIGSWWASIPSHMEHAKKRKQALYQSTNICLGFKVKAPHTLRFQPR